MSDFTDDLLGTLGDDCEWCQGTVANHDKDCDTLTTSKPDEPKKNLKQAAIEVLDELNALSDGDFQARVDKHDGIKLFDEPRGQSSELDQLKHSLGKFVEYFSAIARGEYETNGRLKRIRDFELMILDEACDLIGWRRKEIFRIALDYPKPSPSEPGTDADSFDLKLAEFKALSDRDKLRCLDVMYEAVCKEQSKSSDLTAKLAESEKLNGILIVKINRRNIRVGELAESSVKLQASNDRMKAALEKAGELLVGVATNKTIPLAEFHLWMKELEALKAQAGEGKL